MRLDGLLIALVGFLILSVLFVKAEFLHIHQLTPNKAFVIHIPVHVWSSPDTLNEHLAELKGQHGLRFWSGFGDHGHVCSIASTPLPHPQSGRRTLSEFPGLSPPLLFSEHPISMKYHPSLQQELLNISFAAEIEAPLGNSSSPHQPPQSQPSLHLQHHSSLIIKSVMKLPPTLSSTLVQLGARFTHLSNPQLDGRGGAFLSVVTLPHQGETGRARIMNVLRVLAAHPAIFAIDSLQRHKLRNRDAMKVLFGTSASHLADEFMPLHSAHGEIITVSDTGLDLDHCFFSQGVPQKAVFDPALPLPQVHPSQSKVLAYVSVAFSDGFERLRSDFMDEPNGHGTHVCGSAAGGLPSLLDRCVGAALEEDRTNSEAQLLMIDFGNVNVSRDFLIIPPSLDPLFKLSYDAGSRVHSMSWGGHTPRYTYQAEEIDDFMYRNDDYVVVVAAGNEGMSGLYSVGSPATSKNAISVGASQNSVDSWMAATENTFWEDHHTWLDPEHVFQFPGMYSEEWLADFSSQGPTADNRTKPDVVAPGRMVLSSRAMSGNSSDLLWMQGTSMATPIVSRAVSLVRSMLIHVMNQPSPSAALVKAILIHGATPLKHGIMSLRGVAGSGARNYVVQPKISSLQQGWGRVSLSTFFQHHIGFKDRLGIRGFEEPLKFCFTATGSGVASIVIAWTDPPGTVPRDAKEAGRRVLTNDLDLRVLLWNSNSTDLPYTAPSTVLLGNMESLPDRRNPVEKITLGVSQGDLLRVIVSTSGVIRTPLEDAMLHPDLINTQLFALVWTDSLIKEAPCSTHPRGHPCSMWDPEFECSISVQSQAWKGTDGTARVDESSASKTSPGIRASYQAHASRSPEVLQSILGIRMCDSTSGEYSLERPELASCFPVALTEGLNVCGPGLALNGSECICYSHTPCGDGTFALCQDGVLGSCETLGSVFMSVPDVDPLDPESNDPSECGEATMQWRAVWITILVCGVLSVVFWVGITIVVSEEEAKSNYVASQTAPVSDIAIPPPSKQVDGLRKRR